MIVEYILAIVILAEMDKYKPEIVSPHETRQECMDLARQLNREQAPMLEAQGRAFVCLKVERP